VLDLDAAEDRDGVNVKYRRIVGGRLESGSSEEARRGTADFP
jgi:hypothetical protein